MVDWLGFVLIIGLGVPGLYFWLRFTCPDTKLQESKGGKE